MAYSKLSMELFWELINISFSFNHKLYFYKYKFKVDIVQKGNIRNYAKREGPALGAMPWDFRPECHWTPFPYATSLSITNEK